MSVHRSRNLLVEAAKLYYLGGLTQEAVARRLGMTRSNVSRVLQAAKDSGVVEIRVSAGAERDHQLEIALGAVLQPTEVAIPVRERESSPRTLVAKVGAEVLVERIAQASLLAASWGTTLQAVVEAFPHLARSELEVVQMVGGLTFLDTWATAHDLVRELSRRLGARFRYLNTPAVLDSAETLRHLMEEETVRDTLELASRADVALVGIGSPLAGSSAAVLQLLKLSPAEAEQFWAEGPVGEVCGRYFNQKGQQVKFKAIHDRVLTIEFEDICSIPTVIGVAHGIEKAAAVLGASRAGLVDVLVCDAALARAILHLDASDAGSAGETA